MIWETETLSELLPQSLNHQGAQGNLYAWNWEWKHNQFSCYEILSNEAKSQTFPKSSSRYKLNPSSSK